MKILAVMQNAWFKEPEKVKSIFARRPHLRNELIKRFLFAGCLSGKRLRRTFGDLCDLIVWEEASPEIGGQSSALFHADHEHIQRAIEQHGPDVIVAFGKEASTAIKELWRGEVVYCPHPAARFADIEGRLREGADSLRALLTEATI